MQESLTYTTVFLPKKINLPLVDKSEIGRHFSITNIASGKSIVESNSPDDTKVDSNSENAESQSKLIESSPFIPDGLYELLPKTLKESCDQFLNKRERDVYLTGAISMLSGLLDKISGTYSQQTVYPNLYYFCIAPPASGKGSLVYVKILGQEIHNKLVKESKERLNKYKDKLAEYKKQVKEGNLQTITLEKEPIKPNHKTLFIPANSSSAAVISHLEQNEGVGIICETEADSMGNMFKQDWGGYSDLLRKSYHHESVSYSRKMAGEYYDIEKPKLSMILAGTPSQITNIVNSVEDGLFSRIIFYVFMEELVWRDVSPKRGGNLSRFFEEYSKKIDTIVDYYNKRIIEFELSDLQWARLNSDFANELSKSKLVNNENFPSVIKRHGLMVFRIAMILTAVRAFDETSKETTLICQDVDFRIALNLVSTYLKHAQIVFQIVDKAKPEEAADSFNAMNLYDNLPKNDLFERRNAVNIGESLGFCNSSVDKYLKKLLKKGLIEQRKKYGPYSKKKI